MSDAFLSAANEGRNVLERLVKGLPGISGYVDKEQRRDADYRLRQLIADELATQRAALLNTQNQLLREGGLAHVGDLDVAVGRLQTLIDRVRTAAYGYSGFFDNVRIREQELDALHRFDVAMLQAVAGLATATGTLSGGVADKAALPANISAVTTEVDRLTQLFERRERAIVTPELLTSTGYAPEVRTTEAGLYDLAPVDSSSAPPADFGAPAASTAPAAPAAPAPPAGSMVDPGNYTLTPTNEPPVSPTGSGDVPSGFELIDKP